MYNIVFSPEAIKDLEETKTYIIEELCNEQVATKTVSIILKDISMRKLCGILPFGRRQS